MTKTLIFMKKGDLKPIGGPAGYLYNLYNQLSKSKNENIEFIDEISSKNKFYKYYEKLPTGLKKHYQSYVRRRNVRNLTDKSKKRLTSIDLNNYDNIHFHQTRDMYNIKDSLEDYQGNIILTSHTPKPPYLEYIEDILSPKDLGVLGKGIEQKLSEIDEYAFNRANYVVFPSPEAEDPYINNWQFYRDFSESNKNKYKYLLSGIEPRHARLNREEVCNKYGIPEDAFIISFAGRHNNTKGFDILKLIGEKLLNEDNNVYFLIAGTEAPLKGLTNKRWIEAGWTKDPHSIIAASDLFLLPNKETYFDLIMLEALSLGTPILASETGGNRHFSIYEKTGIQLYQSFEDAIEKINIFRNTTATEMAEYRILNKELFRNNFTAEIFAHNYEELIEEINREKL